MGMEACKQTQEEKANLESCLSHTNDRDQSICPCPLGRPDIGRVKVANREEPLGM